MTQTPEMAYCAPYIASFLFRLTLAEWDFSSFPRKGAGNLTGLPMSLLCLAVVCILNVPEGPRAGGLVPSGCCQGSSTLWGALEGMWGLSPSSFFFAPWH